mmetsp:Transcript_9496/g.17309  ORF Transcript_9496/g.17309 Transcript_9496/m.17309 type:complete len:486 (+) Transcript_9496:115-1572(+)
MAAEEQGAHGRQVVIDAGAAIRLQRIERWGAELFTTGGVYREVRDERARALLQTLPVPLKVREPHAEDILFVKQFAKATGDLGFLSANDMELIALTVRLMREAGLPLKERPALISTSAEGKSVTFDWAPQRATRIGVGKASSGGDWAVAGGGRGSSASAPSEAGQNQHVDGPAATNSSSSSSNPKAATSCCPHEEQEEPSAEGAILQGAQKELEQLSISTPAQEDSKESAAPGDAGQAPAPSGAGDEEVAANPDEAAGKPEEDDSEDGSSAGEWVTQDNMHRFGVGVQDEADVRVTCATADYSVQNVLLQMGITPQTFDGYAVKSVKLWGLICRGCFFFHRDSTKIFCPKCGNDTVVRVPIMVGEDGVPTVMNQGRKLRTKGTIFSMPKPQGGRGWKPVFSEDELRIGGRDRELRHQERVYEKERQMRDPFNEDNGARGWYQRGVTSTGKQINCPGTGAPRTQAGFGRRNPNANNFKGFAPKKRK